MPTLTDPAVIKELLQRHGFSFSRALGQNFIINPGVCPKMAELGGAAPGVGVLEIGPGFGVLTAELCRRAEKVVAIELDDRLPPILAETLKPTLNELTDQNGKKLNLGDLLYDKNGNVTPETVKATQTAVNSYFTEMEKQINAGTAQYESGKKELEDSRKQLDTYKSELEKAEKQLNDGEKELAEARVKLADGEKEFEEKSVDARQKIADGKAELNRGKQQLADAEKMLEKLSLLTPTQVRFMMVVRRLGNLRIRML